MLSIKTILHKLGLLFLLLVGNMLYAQNWPENHGIVDYSSEPKPLSLQGQIVVPTDADSVELLTARLLHRYFKSTNTFTINPYPKG